jgi:16S rRNA (adenine1518-N6/adenine1519-N6)-dimethyltransferase
LNENESVLKPSELRGIMVRHGFQLKKGYGQNFLVDLHVLDAIVDAAAISHADGVFEVGPGAGVVTRPLSFRAKRVVTVEKDRTLESVLTDTVGHRDNVEIVFADVLDVDLTTLWQRFNDCDRVVAVANLPYYVTTPILFHLLESKVRLANIVVMVQKEVADRMMAKPGSKAYGALSVAVQSRAKVTRVATVPPGAFLPPPSVASAVVHLSLYDTPPVAISDSEMFRRVVKAAFGTRRKTLRNALATGFRFSKEEIEAWLNQAGIDGLRRGETLNLHEFAALTEAFPRLGSG